MVLKEHAKIELKPVWTRSSQSGSRLSPAQLFEWALLGMLASAYLALATSGGVDRPTLIFSGLAILARVAVVAKLLRVQIPEIVTTAAAVAYVGFFPIDYYFFSHDFLLATLHLISFLAALVTLRAKTNREYFLVKVIALSQMLAACVLSQTLQFVVFLALFAVSGIVAQISGEIRFNLTNSGAIARSGLKGVSTRVLAVSMFVFMAMIASGAGLFFLLPRTAGMMFRGVQSDRLRMTGYTDEVRLNQVGELQFTSTPVLRARFQNRERVPGVKWRGDALVQFDGLRWFNKRTDVELLHPQNGQFPLVGSKYVWPRGTRVSYEVKLENVSGNDLFFVGRPEVLRLNYPFSIFRSVTGQVRAGNLSGRGLRYQAYSFLPNGMASPNEELDSALREQTLALPPIDPRILALAQQWTAGVGDDYVRAAQIERRLRTGFGYTSILLEKPVADPLAHFLFERKEGHCEYFASAMAVMLRALGIPARMATGFQAGTYNPISGWYMVRGADAHTWVEAFVPGRGWVTFDPTPGDPRRSGSLLAHLSIYLDAADVFWQEWVLSYDLERQILLADRLGRSGRNFSFDWSSRWSSVKGAWEQAKKELPRVAVALIGALFAAVLLVWALPRLLRQWRRHQKDEQLRKGNAGASDATILYERMLALLRARNLEKPVWMTPNEFVQVITDPRLSQVVGELTGAYQGLRFGRQPAMAPKIIGLLEELEAEVRHN